MKDPWAMIYRAEIKGGQFWDGTHERITAWIEKHEDLGVHYDRARGISWINGKTYFTTVVFPTEGDLLAFALTFPENIFPIR